MKKIIVTGIDTNIGKTVASAIICRALAADYWKPIQCGELDNSDTIKVKRLLGRNSAMMHPEAYALKHPLSPHAAAELEGVEISLDEIHLPPAENTLVIEGAGGPMVPLNLRETLLDLISALDADIILISKNYLGSINHTLLCLEVFKQRGLTVSGILISGDENRASELAISSISGIPVIGHIEWAEVMGPEFVTDQADKLRPELQKHLGL
ncbi:MAG: dethiobiotin synthase [Bacteroidota bacterium]